MIILPKSKTPAAARSRRLRKRRRDGAICITVEVCSDEIEEMGRAGLLEPEDTKNREILGRVVGGELAYQFGSGQRQNCRLHSDVLYHGTSGRRFASIKKEGLVRVSPIAERKLCFTPNYDVALYWAELSAWADVGDYDADGMGCILAFSHVTLDRAGYFLTKLEYDPSDQFAWEEEVECWSDVDLKCGDFLIDVEFLSDAAERVAAPRRKRGMPGYRRVKRPAAAE